MRSTVESIQHYQRKIYSSQEKMAKLFRYIHKLHKLPVTEEELQQTGINKTMDALWKFNEEIERAAKHLVKKWEGMPINGKELTKRLLQTNPNEVNDTNDNSVRKILQDEYNRNYNGDRSSSSDNCHTNSDNLFTSSVYQNIKSATKNLKRKQVETPNNAQSYMLQNAIHKSYSKSKHREKHNSSSKLKTRKRSYRHKSSAKDKERPKGEKYTFHLKSSKNNHETSASSTSSEIEVEGSAAIERKRGHYFDHNTPDYQSIQTKLAKLDKLPFAATTPWRQYSPKSEVTSREVRQGKERTIDAESSLKPTTSKYNSEQKWPSTTFASKDSISNTQRKRHHNPDNNSDDFPSTSAKYANIQESFSSVPALGQWPSPQPKIEVKNGRDDSCDSPGASIKSGSIYLLTINLNSLRRLNCLNYRPNPTNTSSLHQPGTYCIEETEHTALKSTPTLSNTSKKDTITFKQQPTDNCSGDDDHIEAVENSDKKKLYVKSKCGKEPKLKSPKSQP